MLYFRSGIFKKQNRKLELALKILFNYIIIYQQFKNNLIFFIQKNFRMISFKP